MRSRGQEMILEGEMVVRNQNRPCLDTKNDYGGNDNN